MLPFLGHVGACWAYVGPMLGLCWSMLGDGGSKRDRVRNHFLKGRGGGKRLLLLFFSLGGGREITISASREGEAATPTLGVRGEGGGQLIIITFFFLWGRGGGR